MSIITCGQTMIQNALINRKYRHDKTAKRFNKTHNCPRLTSKEQDDIDRFWAQFHVKFEDYEWHRMYYYVTGVHDPRFIPQPFAEYCLYLYYNRQDFIPAYADKNMFTTFLPQMRFPVSIGKRVNSHYYDALGGYYGDNVSDQFIDSIFSVFQEKGDDTVQDIIIKETVGSRAGKGVQRIKVTRKEDIKNLLSKNESKNFIIQMAMQQHPFFEQFNEDSVNIMRVTTWRKGDSVYT